jgi:hypothetical protein
MSGQHWGRLAVGLIAIVGNSPNEASAAEPDPIVTIRMENGNAVAGVNVKRAQVLTSEIYAQAGVTLRWMTDDGVSADRTLTIIITTIATAPAGITPEAMGVAPSAGDGSRGNTAYIFVDRVAAFVEKYRVAAEYVFACALAHEIGHLLLPPNAHDALGVMRGSWHPALFPPKAPGVPGFPPAQARLLRLRVSPRQESLPDTPLFPS